MAITYGGLSVSLRTRDKFKCKKDGEVIGVIKFPFTYHSKKDLYLCQIYCPKCGQPITARQPEYALNLLGNLNELQKMILLPEPYKKWEKLVKNYRSDFNDREDSVH